MGATIDIGLPVYNGADTVERAIASVQAQTYRDFRLLVSDNASTDGTGEIVARLAARDPRIELTTHPTNVGPYANFSGLIHRADAPFFAFLAADDWWSPTFLEATHAALAGDPDALCCVPRTAFYAPSGERLHVTSSTSSLTEADPTDRALRFLVHPMDCSRFYGLHRLPTFAQCFDGEGEFHAGDWYIVLLEILAGLHLEVPHVLLHRIATPNETYVGHWREQNKRPFRTLTPLRPLRRQLKRKLSEAQFKAIRTALRRLDQRLEREHRSVEKRARSAGV